MIAREVVDDAARMEPRATRRALHALEVGRLQADRTLFAKSGHVYLDVTVHPLNGWEFNVVEGMQRRHRVLLVCLQFDKII